jgi:hypothetical protein
MNILQKIFNDHYEEMLYILHPHRSVIDNVEKMLNWVVTLLLAVRCMAVLIAVNLNLFPLATIQNSVIPAGSNTVQTDISTISSKHTFFGWKPFNCLFNERIPKIPFMCTWFSFKSDFNIILSYYFL